jgi:uncharacterized protein YqhQ
LSKFHYGGQAVIEGVMIRGQKNMAVAVRDPGGTIVVHTEPLTAGIYTSPIGKWPLVRGLTMLWDTLVLGIRTLMFSADIALGEEEVEFSGPIAWGTIAISLIAAVTIFFLGPLFLVGFIDRFIASSLLSNIIEGLIRLALLSSESSPTMVQNTRLSMLMRMVRLWNPLWSALTPRLIPAVARLFY